MSYLLSSASNPKVAVIGAGIAGVTTAMRLAEMGIDTTLLEKGKDLVNGPPICHLHAGGNLYREISDQQCMALLKQSIDTIKVFEACVNWRPTVIAVPVRDAGSPQALLPRLQRLRAYYAELVASDPSNQLLGHPDDYFRCYSREELELLATRPNPSHPETADDWLIPLAKQVNLSTLQFPVIVVQEYGMSAFRFAASAKMAVERLPKCHLLTEHTVTDIHYLPTAVDSGRGKPWQVEVTTPRGPSRLQFDFLVNAGGYRSGMLDDMIGLKRQRLVEFKAAYIARWQRQGHWPEVIFHGERGSNTGMAQITPYTDGYFQLHGMTESITLFKDGLAANDTHSAQPKLAPHFDRKLAQRWRTEEVHERTRAAIEHAAFFIPAFTTAKVVPKPLFGAQQIPGRDPTLRAVDVFDSGRGYVSVEIVKASSALAAAHKVATILFQQMALAPPVSAEPHLLSVSRLNAYEVNARAQSIARTRGYPEELAQVYAPSANAVLSSKILS